MSFISEAGYPIFERAIRIIVAQWTLLKLAIEHQWGGAHTARNVQQMEDDLLTLLKSRRLYHDELDYFFCEFMSTLNVDAEDGSIEQVSKLMCKLQEDCVAKKTVLISRIIETADADVKKRIVERNHKGENIADEGKDPTNARETSSRSTSTSTSTTATTTLSNITTCTTTNSSLENDGWSVVVKKKKKKRR